MYLYSTAKACMGGMSKILGPNVLVCDPSKCVRAPTRSLSPQDDPKPTRRRVPEGVSLWLMSSVDKGRRVTFRIRLTTLV